MNVKHKYFFFFVFPAWVGTVIILVSGVSLCWHRPEMQIRQGTGTESEEIATHHMLQTMQYPVPGTVIEFIQPKMKAPPTPETMGQYYPVHLNYPSYLNQPVYSNPGPRSQIFG